MMVELVLEKNVAIAILSDSNEAKICRQKLECIGEDDIPGRVTREIERMKPMSNWLFKTHYISIHLTSTQTTKKDIITHIEKYGGIKINEKEIYFSRWVNRGGQLVVRPIVKCPSHEDAKNLLKALNLKELNGEKSLVQLERCLKGITRT